MKIKDWVTGEEELGAMLRHTKKSYGGKGVTVPGTSWKRDPYLEVKEGDILIRKEDQFVSQATSLSCGYLAAVWDKVCSQEELHEAIRLMLERKKEKENG